MVKLHIVYYKNDQIFENFVVLIKEINTSLFLKTF